MFQGLRGRKWTRQNSHKQKLTVPTNVTIWAVFSRARGQARTPMASHLMKTKKILSISLQSTFAWKYYLATRLSNAFFVFFLPLHFGIFWLQEVQHSRGSKFVWGMGSQPKLVRRSWDCKVLYLRSSLSVSALCFCFEFMSRLPWCRGERSAN